mmetsp:Transcript_25868/g.38958  ORF Transcript_25868/g.38958 Transcript_25868/m.38958 type:complete len:126 (-) Transcript_25868:533-910(-)
MYSLYPGFARHSFARSQPHARRRRWLSRLSPLSERRRGPRGGVQLRSVHSFMSRRCESLLSAWRGIGCHGSTWGGIASPLGRGGAHLYFPSLVDAILFASSSWCMTRRLEKRGSPTIVKGSGCKL